MKNRSRLLLVLTLACLAARAPAGEALLCASSLDGLALLAGEPSFPLRWEETSMSDGKPLVVTIAETDGSLFMEFVKAREGLWAEGAAMFCRGSAGLEARIGRLRMGTAAPWLLRGSFGQGRTFDLSRQGAGRLRIGTPGWSGTFIPKPD